MLFMIIPQTRINGEIYNEVLFENYSEDIGQDLLEEIEKKHQDDIFHKFDLDSKYIHQIKKNKTRTKIVNIIKKKNNFNNKIKGKI